METRLLRFSSAVVPRGGMCGIPLGAVLSPFAAFHPPPPLLQRLPVLCHACAAYANLYCSIVGSGGWRCCFCGHINPCYAEALQESNRHMYPELSSNVVEYEDGSSDRSLSSVVSGIMSGLSLATGPHRRRGAAIVFVVDGCLPRATLKELASSLFRVLRSLPPDTTVALLVYTGVVSVYQLGKAGAAVAMILPGAAVPSEEDTRSVLQDGTNFVTLADDLTTLTGIISLLHGCDGATTVENVEENGTEKPGRTTRRSQARCPSAPPHRHKRALGAAVAYALRMARIAGEEGHAATRIVVCAGGRPTCGPGAVAMPLQRLETISVDVEQAAEKYFTSLSAISAELGTGIDVFCAGSEPLAVSVLSSLVRLTGGYVILGLHFDDAFERTLLQCLGQHCLTHNNGDTKQGEKKSRVPACVLDVRTCGKVGLERVIGPIVVTEDHDDIDSGAWSAGVEAASAGTDSVTHNITQVTSEQEWMHRMVMGRVDPHTAISLYFSVTEQEEVSIGRREHSIEKEEGEWAHFQCVVRTARSGGARIVRVVTCRLPVVAGNLCVVGGLDADVAATLFAKEIVLDAEKGRHTYSSTMSKKGALTPQTKLDDSLRHMARAHRAATGKRDLPPAHETVVRRLFHLRRGPLLNTAAASSDDACAAHALFLRAPVPEAVRWMEPSVLAVSLVPTPGEDLGRPVVGHSRHRSLIMTAWDAAAAQLPGGSGPSTPRRMSDSTHTASPPSPWAKPPRQVHSPLPFSLSPTPPQPPPLVLTSSAPPAAPPTANPSPNPQTTLAYTPVPAETLSLLPLRALIMDTQNAVCVWRGAGASATVTEAAIRRAETAAAAHFPTARVIIVKEGTSAARHFTSRLAPSHKEPVKEEGPMGDALRELRSRLPYTDDLSYNEYLFSLVSGR